LFLKFRKYPIELNDSHIEEFDPKCQEHLSYHGSICAQSRQCEKM